jgi:hypothetical protein
MNRYKGQMTLNFMVWGHGSVGSALVLGSRSLRFLRSEVSFNAPVKDIDDFNAGWGNLSLG